MDIDLHIHTTAYSPCSHMSPDELMIAAKEAGLDGICITEHNRIWTAEDAKALSDKHGLAIFRGVKSPPQAAISLCSGLEEEPDGILTPAELKQKVDAANAVAIAAHPFRGFLLFGFGALSMDLESAMENPTFSHVHGLEVCNGLVTEEENDFAGKVAAAMAYSEWAGAMPTEPWAWAPA